MTLAGDMSAASQSETHTLQWAGYASRRSFTPIKYPNQKNILRDDWSSAYPTLTGCDDATATCPYDPADGFLNAAKEM